MLRRIIPYALRYWPNKKQLLQNANCGRAKINYSNNIVLKSFLPNYIIMNFQKYTGMIRQIVFASLLFFSICCYAQTGEKSTNKIELSVKTKQGMLKYSARSLSLAFNNPSKGAPANFLHSDTDPSGLKKYFLAIDFDTMDTALLKLFTDYSTELSGELKVTGKDGRTIQRIEFSGATLDNVSSQSSADDANVYIYLWCREINVNDVKLK